MVTHWRCQVKRESDGERCLLSIRHAGKVPCRFDRSPAPAPTPAIRKAIKDRFRTKSEARYAQYLEGLRLAGEIVRWEYEPITLKIGVDCRYTPDFLVVTREQWSEDAGPMITELQFREVKGPHAHREKGIVKLRAAAKQYPEFSFMLVTIDCGHWTSTEITQ